MPEGDSIHGLARRLGPLLVDDSIVRAVRREQGELTGLVGARVSDVSAQGKHLLFRFELAESAPIEAVRERPRAWTLRVHLGMKGRVRSYESGTEPKRIEFAAPVVFWTCRWCIACFVSQAEFSKARRSPALDRLGPDLLGEAVRWSAVVRRIRERGRRPLWEVLLDQGIAAGIGNVYRSEVLFLSGLHPDTATDEVDDETLESIYRLARDLLLANVRPGMRNTVRPERRQPGASGRLWVYRRVGQPCRRCGVAIQIQRVGDGARSVYFCTECQPRKPERE